MTSTEETPAPSTEESLAAASEPVAGADPSDAAIAQDPADALSPAVRRLVRQYDLDITGIHGTGPDGRIRVGDVINVLGPRAEQAVRGRVAPRPAVTDDGDDELGATAEPSAEASPARATEPVTTTIFECELGRALAHRKTLRADDIDVLLTSYFVVACADALGSVPDPIANEPARLGVQLTMADGQSHALALDATGLVGTLTERLRLADTGLRTGVGADLAETSLLIHHYGASGSLLATPTPIGPGRFASLGIGRVRREIVLRNVDGDDTPRVGARCYVSLSFLPERLTLARANEFLAHVVRLLELWPD